MALESFYINLEKRPAKFAAMTEKFPEATRLIAVDGQEETVESILPYRVSRSWRDPYWKRRTTKGEVGCILSHINLWKKCLVLNEPIVILEDDIQGSIDYEKVESYLNEFDLLYLSRRKFKKDYIYKEINEELEEPGYCYWTCAYAITPRAAAHLLEYFYENPLIPADEILPLAIGASDISSLSDTWKHPYLKSAAFKIDMVLPESDESDTEDLFDLWEDYKVHVLTVATDESKAHRLFKVANTFDLINLGKDVEWKGGTMEGPGGGQKLNLVKNFLNTVDEQDIIIFVDGYDTWIDQGTQQIIERYFGFRSEVVFAAESTCWPDQSLASSFPETGGYKYLNSGCYVGTAKELKKILEEPIEDHEDDQLYLQKKYLSKDFNISLDWESYLFFCLSGVEDFCGIDPSGWIVNKHTNCTTCIVHGNGGPKAKERFETFYDQRFAVTEIVVVIDDVPEEKTPAITPYETLHEDIIFIPNFIDKSWCKDLIDYCNKYFDWHPLPDDIWPAHEIRLNTLYNFKFFEEYEKAFWEKAAPLISSYWDSKVYGIRDLFAIKYSLDTQTSLGAHHDHSLVSGSLKLNDDYEGGQLYFKRQAIDNTRLQVGDLLLWPGQVTHLHESKELLSGEKYALTLWTARHEGDDIISNNKTG